MSERQMEPERLFRAIDDKDLDIFAQFLADFVSFRFGNAQAVHGKHQVCEVVGQFFASLASLRHEVVGNWNHGDTCISHGHVTYIRHDGSQLSVPFANVFTMQDDKIIEYLIFVDISDLYASA